MMKNAALVILPLLFSILCIALYYDEVGFDDNIEDSHRLEDSLPGDNLGASYDDSLEDSFGDRQLDHWSYETCEDYPGVVYTGAPCYYNRRELRHRWFRRWTRSWRQRSYQQQCTAYTCGENIDCNSSTGRIKCPQTCGYCETVWDALKSNYTEFANFLEQLGLDYPLSRRNVERTVFAPTDAAFTAFLEQDTVVNYTDNEVWGEHMRDLALYHILPQWLTTDDIDDGDQVKTIQGSSVTFTVIPNDPIVVEDEAQIANEDTKLRNGVVHGINGVLLPQSAAMSTMEYLENSPEHTNFSFYLNELSFEEILQDGPYTVFAPTDDAFAQLEGLDDLETDEETDALLSYHIIDGNYFSFELFHEGELPTLQGENARFDALFSVLFVNKDEDGPITSGAQVVTKNILTSTGIIHVIDEVLIPSELDDTLNKALSSDESCTDVSGSFTPDGAWNWKNKEFTCAMVEASVWRGWYCQRVYEQCPFTCNRCGKRSGHINGGIFNWWP